MKSKADYYSGMVTPFLLAGILVPAILLRAWVITIMWNWYVVSAFGVSPLKMAYAFGFSVMIGMFTGRQANKENNKPWLWLAQLFTDPLMALLLGWIGTFFIHP
jgi:hypothetical protein